MRISILGGTGGLGEGLALRLVKYHDILIGSRNADKAKKVAEEYSKIAKEYYKDEMEGRIDGGDNLSIAKDCDILILSIPYEHTRDTCSRISSIISDDAIIITPIVPMRKGKAGFEYIPMHDHNSKSAASIVAEEISNPNRIVSALHTISEVKLRKIDQPLDCDTYVCCDDKDIAYKVIELLKGIEGLRPLYIGALSLSYQIEALTPMLLNAAKSNKIKHPGIRIV